MASIALGLAELSRGGPWYHRTIRWHSKAYTLQPQCEICLPWQRSKEKKSQDNSILTNQVAALDSPAKMDERVRSI